MSITIIEDFSNEIFYEIFEYLDGFKTFKAFSNLNHRFTQLLNSSSFLFNLDLLCSKLIELNMNIYEQLLLNNKHQILSFRICLPREKCEFFSSLSIDSSFNHLESVFLNSFSPAILMSLLTNLSCLPRLFSLTIDTELLSTDLSEAYRLILVLPKLKYATISAFSSIGPKLLPIATDEQTSTIEHLIINHDCTLNELCILLSYTPKLYRLNLLALTENYSHHELIFSFSCPNLTYLAIEMAYIRFDEFEMFIMKTKCNLKDLHINALSEDRDYLDSNRWEKLICNYLIELKEFYLEYRQAIDPESGSITDFKPPDQCNSLFWLEKKWTFEVEMDSFNYVYSICSYKKRWYDVNSSIELSKSTRLTLVDLPDDDHMMVFHLIIRDLLLVTQIYHLEITKETICFNILIKLTYKLSSLDSLKITSLIQSQFEYPSIKDKNFHFVSKKINITKVYLEKMSAIDEIYFLMRLCPRMTHLKVDFINDMDIELFIRNILKKINKDRNQYLRSLCIRKPTASDEIIQKLEEMIYQGQLLNHFTITSVDDNIYLQWK
ncbi:unnamed protein product [Rotaria sp. Silwood1]|nr:unnamed protein product [Rotaria sp. Silwood1]CAF1612462.1 unnamed protein product [Rotaria sp. Silwood1]